MTEWRKVRRDPDYEVSDQGEVRSWKTWRGKPGPRLLKPAISSHGYLVVSIERRRMVHVHQLVTEAFLGPRPRGLVVRHLDGNHLNNSLANLTYGTQVENMLDRSFHGRCPQANKTHCKRGHEFTPENTRRSDGRRVCRACARANAAKYVAKKKARAAGDDLAQESPDQ